MTNQERVILEEKATQLEEEAAGIRLRIRNACTKKRDAPPKPDPVDSSPEPDPHMKPPASRRQVFSR